MSDEVKFTLFFYVSTHENIFKHNMGISMFPLTLEVQEDIK